MSDEQPSIDEQVQALETIMRLAAVMSHLDTAGTLLKGIPNHQHLNTALDQIGGTLVKEADRLGRILAHGS